VAITGIGPVTPVGVGVAEFWEAIAAGRSGAGPITRFDATDYPVRIAAEVPDFDPEVFLERKLARRLGRFSQFALVAAQLALEHARLDPSTVDPARVAVVVGTGIGGVAEWVEEFRVLAARGPRRVNPAAISLAMPNAAAAAIAIAHGFSGPNEATASACASSGHAIARAADLIRSGRADVAIAGGAEAAITPMGVAAFAAGRALSLRNHEPERASRPFDTARDGFVLAEGATVLVLESMAAARARQAPVHAELLGYGLSCDAYNLTAPQPDGAAALAAMRSACEDAGVPPSRIGYVNAHATATRLGDIAEALAIRKLFGDQPPPTSSTKSMTGHLIGAAGATEAAITALALQAGVLPPTINYETPDPACDLDVVPNRARPCRVTVGLSNTFGFGGHNASLVMGATSADPSTRGGGSHAT
jgi:3-oxoacyl-[acyl-carrier-protein] synthase II